MQNYLYISSSQFGKTKVHVLLFCRTVNYLINPNTNNEESNFLAQFEIFINTYLLFFQMTASSHLLVFCLLATGAVVRADDGNWAWKKSDDEAATTTPESEGVVTELKKDDNTSADVDVVPAGGNDTEARHFIKDRLCDLGLGGVSLAKQSILVT